MNFVQTLITIVCSVMASSGFWAFMMKRAENKDKKNENKECFNALLLGLAHDRIMQLCMYYLERGDWITQDEYENLNKYLYGPYVKSGGNGTAERAMKDVNARLRIVNLPPVEKGSFK